jgi:hypothetical protein
MERSPWPIRPALPGLSSILADFGAPVAIAEVPTVGAWHRFGTEGVDYQLWSVDVETMFGLEVRAVARTFRPVPRRLVDTEPESLCANTLSSFLAATGDASDVEHIDRVTSLVAAAPRSHLDLLVMGVPRRVSAITCGDFTGVTTELAGNTIVAVIPSVHTADANLGAITAPTL